MPANPLRLAARGRGPRPLGPTRKTAEGGAPPSFRSEPGAPLGGPASLPSYPGAPLGGPAYFCSRDNEAAGDSYRALHDGMSTTGNNLKETRRDTNPNHQIKSNRDTRRHKGGEQKTKRHIQRDILKPGREGLKQDHREREREIER